ncbi:MAG: hypothetical protein ACLFTT_17300 [Candidatus Hydrogenedentota bacterium]
MKRCLCGALTLAYLLSGPAAFAQQGGKGYDAMEVTYIGELVGDFGARLDEMTGGVEITLLASDDTMEPLPIKARTMKFDYEGEAVQPSRILMEGGVTVAHPMAEVRADQAVWDFDSGELAFAGNVVINSEQMKDVEAEQFVLNLETQRYRMNKVHAKNVSLPQAGNDTDPSLLTPGGIEDLPGFITTLKEDIKADAPNPGKRVHSLLNDSGQRILTDAPVDSIVANEDTFLKHINRVLHNPQLYDADAWAQTDLPEAADALLGRDDLGAKERTRLNRLLLHAAYPAHVLAP